MPQEPEGLLFCEKYLLFHAVTAFVKQKLEYCSAIWNPYRQQDIKKLEDVQRRFTKRLRGMKGISYDMRLKILKTDSLQIRRLKTDLKLYYCILNGCLDPSFETFLNRKDSVTRGNEHSLCLPKFNNNLERYLFHNRWINI